MIWKRRKIKQRKKGKEKWEKVWESKRKRESKRNKDGEIRTGRYYKERFEKKRLDRQIYLEEDEELEKERNKKGKRDLGKKAGREIYIEDYREIEKERKKKGKWDLGKKAKTENNEEEDGGLEKREKKSRNRYTLSRRKMATRQEKRESKM